VSLQLNGEVCKWYQRADTSTSVTPLHSEYHVVTKNAVRYKDILFVAVGKLLKTHEEIVAASHSERYPTFMGCNGVPGEGVVAIDTADVPYDYGYHVTHKYLTIERGNAEPYRVNPDFNYAHFIKQLPPEDPGINAFVVCVPVGGLFHIMATRDLEKGEEVFIVEGVGEYNNCHIVHGNCLMASYDFTDWYAEVDPIEIDCEKVYAVSPPEGYEGPFDREISNTTFEHITSGVHAAEVTYKGGMVSTTVYKIKNTSLDFSLELAEPKSKPKRIGGRSKKPR